MAWPRRNRGMSSPRERSVLGGTHLHNARSKIESLCQRSIKVLAPFEPDMATVLPWCFSDDTRMTLRHAHDLVPHNHYGWGLATNGTYRITEGTEITFEFEQMSMLAPKPEMFNVDPVAGQPLLDAIHQIQVIKSKFDLAEHVLNWLDEHVTAGAMRYYWPTVLSLAPLAPTLGGEIPSRFNTPGNITPFLPFIRESASTIASALMLSEDIDINTNKGMSLMLSGNGMKIGEDTLGAVKRTINL
jgi:hypothetical protein